MEISCIVSPQKPESISTVYDITHLEFLMRTEKDFFPTDTRLFFIFWKLPHRREFICNWHEQDSELLKFQTRDREHERKARKMFKCFLSCHNSSPERIFSSFLFFFLSWGSSQKAKQLKLFFSFMDFSIPLNVLSKLFQFLFSGIIFLHSPQEFWQTFFLLLLFLRRIVLWRDERKENVLKFFQFFDEKQKEKT